MINKIKKIEIGDVVISIESDWKDIPTLKRYTESKREEQARLTLKKDIFEFMFPSQPPIPEFYETKKPNLVVETNYSFDLHLHAGLLASIISKRWDFVHGAGLIKDGKGILLIGPTRSGKSTISTQIGGYTLSDDNMLVDGNEMKLIGNYGQIINKKTKTLNWNKVEDNQHKIDAIFLLDKYHKNTFIVKRNPNESFTEYFFDDKINPVLTEVYKNNLSADFQAPIYQVGTRGRKKQMSKLICDVIRNKIC